MYIKIFKMHKITKNTLLIIAMAAISLPTLAQRYNNNPISQFYRNGYLWNPAMAGQEKGTRLYGLLNKSWIGFDGAPKYISFAGDMKIGEKSGVGLQLVSDKSGVLQRYMGVVSYSYVVKLSEKQNLRIGGDLNLYKEQLDNSVVNSGSQVDPTGKLYEDNGMEVNGNLGLSYETENFNLSATGYNIGAYSKKADERSADLAIAQFLTSYKFLCEDGKVSLRPLVAYKMYYKHEDILTAAMQLEYDNAFHASVYWQNTGNLMGGVGLMLKNLGEVNFFYSGKNKYGYNEQFEVGLKINISKKD